MPLTVIDAVGLTPTSVPIAAWRDDCAAARADPTPDHYAGIAALMFAEAGADPQGFGDTAAMRVPVATGLTQFDLAHRVATDLIARTPVARAACRVVIHLAASLDEDVYASTVGKLTAALDLHRALHFSVGQLGAAALAGALDIVDAMLATDPAACALVVAAERWPLPLPRLLDGVTALADGAAALLLSTASDAAGLRIVATANSSGPAFLDPRHGRDDRRGLIDGAVAAVAGLAAVHAVATDDLVWLPSDLGEAIDREVIARTGGRSLAAMADAGLNRMSAAVPHHLAETFARPEAIAGLAGRTLVGWGASYAGGFGITFFQPAERTVH